MVTSCVASPVMSRRPPIMLPRGIFYGWVIVAVSFMGNWITAPINPVVFSIFIVSIREDLGVSLGTLAWCISLRQIAAGFAAPVLGQLVDRYGPRWLGMGCAAWAGACLCAVSFASSIWWMYALFFLSGFSGFGVFGGGQILTGVPPANWFVAKRGRAVSYAAMGGGLGTACWAIISSYLVTIIGWRDAWFYYGIIIPAVLVPAYGILMRRRPEDVGLYPDGAASPPIEGAAMPGPGTPARGAALSRQTSETNFTLRQALRTSALWLMVLAFMFHTFATNSILFLRVPYWTDLGVSPGWIGIAVASDPFVVMLFTLLFGYMAERYPVVFITATGGVFRALSMAPLLVVSPHAAWAFAHNITWGVGSAGMGTGQNIAIPNYFGRLAQGAIRGFTAPIMISAGSVSPPLIGYLLDAQIMDIDVVFMGAAVMMFAAGAIFLVIRTPTLPPPVGATSR